MNTVPKKPLLPDLRNLLAIAGILVSIGALIQNQRTMADRQVEAFAKMEKIAERLDVMQGREVELAKWQAVHEAEEKAQDRRLDDLEVQGVKDESTRVEQNRRIGKMEGR